MPSSSKTAAVLALALLSAPALARAEGLGLKHEKTIYLDDKEGPLKTPEGVACDDNGAFVVADTGNGRLLTFAWKDSALSGGTPVKLGQLPYPTRVQIDSKGNVLVLDRKVRKIGRVDAKGGFGGYVEIAGAVPPILPVAFKVGPADQLYVLDAAGARVLVLEPGGKVTSEIPLPKPGTFTDLGVDPAGNVYAVDAVAAVVWKADKGASTFQALSKSLKDRMSFPGYLAVQGGKLYLVDQNGDGIVILAQDGSYQGRELSMGWTDGLVYYPAQICVNARGDTFIADRLNSRVQVFEKTK